MGERSPAAASRSGEARGAEGELLFGSTVRPGASRRGHSKQQAAQRAAPGNDPTVEMEIESGKVDTKKKEPADA